MIIKNKELLEKLKGTHNLNSIAKILNVNKKKAIYYVYRLRKRGYVTTKKDEENRRIYNISFENKLRGYSYIDTINKHSRIKVNYSKEHVIYGKKPTTEEALVFAINSRELRLILASMALFNKIKNWPRLYSLAKKSNVKREICALYELVRTVMRTRKMTRRFKTNSLPKKEDKYKYLVRGLNSKDFKNIEKKWKVYVPFNLKDLSEHR